RRGRRVPEQQALDADEMRELILYRPPGAVGGELPLPGADCPPHVGHGRPHLGQVADHWFAICRTAHSSPSTHRADLAQAGRLASMASITSGASGSTSGLNRRTISPVGETRTFSRLQCWSPASPTVWGCATSSA